MLLLGAQKWLQSKGFFLGWLQDYCMTYLEDTSQVVANSFDLENTLGIFTEDLSL